MLLFWLFPFGAVILLTYFIGAYSRPVDLVQSWFLAVTAVTFLTFGYDKVIAGTKMTRVPETVLLALTFSGGTVGAILGRWLFGHKTKKTGFRVKFWILVFFQFIALGAFYVYFRTR